MENVFKSFIPYDTYIERVKNIAIAMSKEGKQAFIWPDYKYMIMQENLEPERCEVELTWDDISEILHLEVEMWNKTQSEVWQTINAFVNSFKKDLQLMDDKSPEEIKNILQNIK